MVGLPFFLIHTRKTAIRAHSVGSIWQETAFLGKDASLGLSRSENLLMVLALNPTPPCTEWRTKMAGEPEAAAKLQNILDEQCIAPAVESKFFQELEGQLTGTPWPAVADPVVQGKAAAMRAINAVAQVAPALYCQGPKLDHPAGFAKLARLRTAKKYYKYLPPRDRDAFLDGIFKTEGEFEAADASQLRQWIEDHLKSYTGDLNLGSR